MSVLNVNMRRIRWSKKNGLENLVNLEPPEGRYISQNIIDDNVMGNIVLSD